MSDDPWIYLRLHHAATETAGDDVLGGFVAPVTARLLAEGAIDRFFFLRYAEDGPHVRLRLRATGRVPKMALESQLGDQASGCSAIDRVVRAVYEPEVDKHGGLAGLEIAERQFFASSELALGIVRATAALPGARLILGGWAIATIFAEAGLDDRVQNTRDYGAYWARFAEAAGSSSPRSAAAEAEVVELLRGCLANPSEVLAALDPGLPALAARWQSTVARDLGELRASLATAPRKTVAWNLGHTMNNRLGLGPALEHLAAELLVAATRATGPELDPRALVRSALAERRATLLVVRGDAGALLQHLRVDHPAARFCELSPHDEPTQAFGLWRSVARGLGAEGATLAALRCARHAFDDPECPLLPDPLGVRRAIWRALEPSLAPETVLVLRDVDHALADCLDVLAYVARAMDRQPLAIVACTGASDVATDAWAPLLGELVRDRRATVVALASRAERPRSDPAVPTTLAAGIALCRAGAARTGALVLATALAQGATDVPRADALTVLAMATLQRGQPDAAARLARAALSSASAGAPRRRARRVAMAALHASGEHALLAELGAEANAELALLLAQRQLDETERESVGWLRLDAALASSVRDAREHESCLDALLASAAPLQCLATAQVWRGATLFAAGRLADASAHQEAACALFESFSDARRGLHTRLRLAGTRAALGEAEAAAGHALAAALDAVAAGDWAVAGSAFVEAISATPNFRPELAISMLETANRHSRVFDSPWGQKLHSYCAIHVTLGNDDIATAECEATSLLEEVVASARDDTPASWTLGCRLALFLNEVNRMKGDMGAASNWLETASRMCALTPPEDRVRFSAIVARNAL